MILWLVFWLMVGTITLSIALFLWDAYRNRNLGKVCPAQVSFIIPCYNDGDSIDQTITSVTESCPSAEIIIVNDCSTDDSRSKLQAIVDKLDNVRVIDNATNLGKVRSVNAAAEYVTNDLFFIIDADVIVNPRAIQNVLARFEANPKIGAVSCPYLVKKGGFIETMQEVEYGMLTLVQGSYNCLVGTPSLWGGCMAVRKRAFLEAGRLSENAIIEDMDMAFKLLSLGWKVEQSHIPIRTYVPGTIRAWWKQKLRWTSGSTQCLVKHYKVWLKNPMFVICIFCYGIIVLASVAGLVLDSFYYTGAYQATANITQVGHVIGPKLIQDGLYRTLFCLFALPYAVLVIKRRQDLYKLLYVFPFSLIYFPALAAATIAGAYIYIKRHRQLTRGERGW